MNKTQNQKKKENNKAEINKIANGKSNTEKLTKSNIVSLKRSTKLDNLDEIDKFLQTQSLVD